MIRVYLQSPIHIAFTQSPNWGLPGRCHDMRIALEIKKFELCLFYCMSHCRHCLSSFSITVIKVARHGQLKGSGLKFQRDQPIPQDRANWRDMEKLADHIVSKFKRQSWTGTELGLCSLKPPPKWLNSSPSKKAPQSSQSASAAEISAGVRPHEPMGNIGHSNNDRCISPWTLIRCCHPYRCISPWTLIQCCHP